MTLRGYSLGTNVNTAFCKYPIPEFSHESSHRIPCVHTCFVNSKAIYFFSYPQLPAKLTFKNSVPQGEIGKISTQLLQIPKMWTQHRFLPVPRQKFSGIKCKHSVRAMFIFLSQFSWVSKILKCTVDPGGYSWEFLMGVCCWVPQILTLFQTKKCHFPHPFLDQSSKIHTVFKPGL